MKCGTSGILPLSRRQQNDDDFSKSTNRDSSNNNSDDCYSKILILFKLTSVLLV